jgi:hypothetical protein
MVWLFFIQLDHLQTAVTYHFKIIAGTSHVWLQIGHYIIYSIGIL